MVGMHNNGPWPKCVGLIGEECAEYIENLTENINTVIISPSDGTAKKGFDPYRVRIFVDDDNIVTVIPRLG